MAKKNDIVTLEITDITPEGSGVGKIDGGYVLFVPGTAPGDVIEARVLKAEKSYGYAKVESVISPSPFREEQPCPVFPRCGGCLYRHIKYEKELEIKKNWVIQNFRRIGGFDVGDIEIFSAGTPDGYRNKAQYPAEMIGGKLRFGFYSAHSHRVAPCRACALQPPFYADIVGAAEDFLNGHSIKAYNEENGTGVVRHFFVRHGAGSGEVMVSLIINADELPYTDEFVAAVRGACTGIVSVSLIVNKKRSNEILGDKCVTVYGKDHITDVLCGMKFDISPLSFYQVNHDGAELLYGLAKEQAALSGGETLLDLYCGAGTIGLSMAKDAGRLIGVEIIPAAVENARENAKLNGIKNAEFICADAGEAAKKLADGGIMPDVVVLDPPRKGCGADVYAAIDRMRPKKIVMISCSSATGARDAAEFGKMGYKMEYLAAVDMFPRTGHCEVVVSMSRVGSKL